MKIGIMGAMLEEVSELKKNMQIEATHEIGAREYHCGELYGIDTVLVFSRCGKVASASTATTLVGEFDVDYIIFTGVAGATDSSLNIGDIVIGEKAHQHDMDATPLFKKHEIPLLGKIFFEADLDLIEKAYLAASEFLAEGKDLFGSETLARFSINEPKVYRGAIASGDKFVAHPLAVEQLLKDVPETMAVEMEGAAVAQICFEHQIPFVIIRTISDKADHSAAIDFQSFIDEISAHYSREIIKKLYYKFQDNN